VTSSATVGRQMPPEVRAAIIREATAAGLDPEMMLKIASLESGGNPHAISSTGAVGVYQFTSGTASDFGLSNRFDMVANVSAAMKLTKRSLTSLKKAGIHKAASNELYVYLSHQIGAQGAKEVLSASRRTLISSLSSSTKRSIRVNIGGNSKTVGQYLDANQDALNDKLNAQNSSSEAPVPVRLAEAATPPVKVSSAPVPSVSTGTSPPSSKTSASPSTKVASSSEAPQTVPRQSSPVQSDSSYSPKDEVVAVAPPQEAPVQGRSSSPSPSSDSGSSKQLPSSLIRLESGMLVGLG
jgi:hypothetical protein